jgi:hypothetical protein
MVNLDNDYIVKMVVYSRMIDATIQNEEMNETVDEFICSKIPILLK